MSETKHTPGPWEWHMQQFDSDDGRIEWRPMITGADQSDVAEVPWQGDTGKPDAALIAAAPDLLAACEAMLDRFGGTASAHAPTLGRDRDAAARSAARAAIAKAKGE